MYEKGCTCAGMAQENYIKDSEISDILFKERVREKK